MRIENITRSQPIKDDEERWKLVTPTGENIFRLWVTGIVTEKYTGDNNYVGLKVEDGTGTVVAKTWDGRLDQFNKWDKIEVLGQIQISERDENIDVFVSPDISRIISDDNWFLVHRLKIIQQLQSDTSVVTNLIALYKALGGGWDIME